MFVYKKDEKWSVIFLISENFPVCSDKIESIIQFISFYNNQRLDTIAKDDLHTKCKRERKRENNIQKDCTVKENF